MDWAPCGSARDRVGRALGKYRLQEILGAGGTAVVYKALGPDGVVVAVKVLHDHLSRTEEIRRRFMREGELGLVLDHPSTVRALDHGVTDEGSPYLVLEYLEGESLEELRTRAGGRLELMTALDVCDQLLAVLEVAHAKNIIHRDIKPSNLFMTRAGALKVLDFGIARRSDDTSASATKTGQTVGTPAFMPPEQALSRPRDVDPRTDIWSVGATLFTLLSGEYVHVAENSSEHLVKAATLPARSLAVALPGVPANVEALVARCLAFDKDGRWSSAMEMRAELSSVRADPGRRIGTSTSPPPSTGGHSAMNVALTPPARRDELVRPGHRWLLPVAVASTAGLVLMSALVLLLAVRSTTASRAASEPDRASWSPTGGRASSSPTGGREVAVAASPAAEAPAPVVPALPVTVPEPPVVLPPARATPSSSSVTGKKPRKDVYRPF
jgi:serine/threonine-protein kinase